MKSGPQVLLAFWSVAVIFWSRVFFSARVALSLDGERAEPLANMLFGAKHANIAQHMPEARLPRSRRDARTL